MSYESSEGQPESFNIFSFDQRIALEHYLGRYTIEKVNKFKDSISTDPQFFFLKELDKLKSKLDNLLEQGFSIDSLEVREVIGMQEKIALGNKNAWDIFRDAAKKIIETDQYFKLKGHSGLN